MTKNYFIEILLSASPAENDEVRYKKNIMKYGRSFEKQQRNFFSKYYSAINFQFDFFF